MTVGSHKRKKSRGDQKLATAAIDPSATSAETARNFADPKTRRSFWAAVVPRACLWDRIAAWRSREFRFRYSFCRISSRGLSLIWKWRFDVRAFGLEWRFWIWCTVFFFFFCGYLFICIFWRGGGVGGEAAALRECCRLWSWTVASYAREYEVCRCLILYFAFLY